MSAKSKPDGYEGYNAVASQPGITQLCCMAHARRKFMEAKKAQPKNKVKTRGKADVAIDMIGKLYGLERAYKSAKPETLYQMRQEKAKPVIDKLRKWLDKTVSTVPLFWSNGTGHFNEGQ